MELSFLELQKREVISVTDGKSLGYPKDVGFSFPNGIMTGIFVPGRKLRGLKKCFNKTLIFVERTNVIKIGGDVILVDLYKKGKGESHKKPSCPPSCPPPCEPPCPPNRPPCPPPFPPKNQTSCDGDDSFRIDLGDY